MPREPGPGGPDDLGGLYDRPVPSLYRYALLILADPAAAEDVVQDVFAAVVRRGISDVRSSEAYLQRAVRNGCYSVLRRRRRTVRADDASERDPLLLEAMTTSADRPEERLAFEHALRRLPPDQREVVHLKVFEGWTFQAIADMTGDSINTIASRYRYAMEKLRATWGDRR
jgi:RNA polymerase sigma-70 factor (ECF subfamily)